MLCGSSVCTDDTGTPPRGSHSAVANRRARCRTTSLLFGFAPPSFIPTHTHTQKKKGLIADHRGPRSPREPCHARLPLCSVAGPSLGQRNSAVLFAVTDIALRAVFDRIAPALPNQEIDPVITRNSLRRCGGNRGTFRLFRFPCVFESTDPLFHSGMHAQRRGSCGIPWAPAVLAYVPRQA